MDGKVLPKMNDAEAAKLRHSAEVLKDIIRQVAI